jgi:hypothetical protein
MGMRLPAHGMPPGGAGSTAGPSGRWSERAAWFLLLLLLAAYLPLFLCMPLYNDVTYYDVCARNVLQGGVHFRDIFDTNLPGIIWAHIVLRWLLGWRSETLRLVDFLIVVGIAALLVRWLRDAGLPRAAQAWTALALFAFYFATPEVCHCQRDIWMLLLALTALSLRRRQLLDLVATPVPPHPTLSPLGGEGRVRGLVARAVAEGICWAVAFWIKPFVAIPAVVCWLICAVRVRPASARALGVLALDVGSVLAGGLLTGGLGLALLWWSGSWSAFWDVLLHWDMAEYLHTQRAGIPERTWFVFKLFRPWCFLHVVALLLAAVAIVGGVRRPAARLRLQLQDRSAHEPLLAALYLGWLLQACYVQYEFAYHLVPPLFLALALLGGRRWLLGRSRVVKFLVAGFAALAVIWHPALDVSRLAVWGRCWREGSSAEVRNQLAFHSEPVSPDWVALARVAEFLRGQQLGDGELTCFSYGTNPLYLDLGLQPSTRFINPQEVLYLFGSREQEIVQELRASPQRLLVTDLQAAGYSKQLAAKEEGDPRALPPDFPPARAQRYPWCLPVVFRAGQYLVHQADRAAVANQAAE